MKVYYIILINYETHSFGLVGIYSRRKEFEEAVDSLRLSDDEEIDTGEIEINTTNDLEFLRQELTSL